METHFSKKRLFTLLVLTAGLAAYANVRAPVRSDPWEGMNRAMFEFNDTVDRAALQPVARVYHRTLPQGVRTRVSNFFFKSGRCSGDGELSVARSMGIQRRKPDAHCDQYFIRSGRPVRRCAGGRSAQTSHRFWSHLWTVRYSSRALSRVAAAWP